MKVTNIYFKSLEPVGKGLGIKTYNFNGDSKEVFQTLRGIIKTRILKTNTKHSQLKDRLCVSLPTNTYTGGYRPEGILFTTEQIPDYCSPIDLMALTSGETFTSSDYNGKFIKRSSELIFDSVESMFANYRSPEEAREKVVKLRNAVGLKPLERRFSYNECCFEKNVKINPIGLVGQSNAIAETARKTRLMVYPSIKTFIKYHSKEIR